MSFDLRKVVLYLLAKETLFLGKEQRKMSIDAIHNVFHQSAALFEELGMYLCFDPLDERRMTLVRSRHVEEIIRNAVPSVFKVEILHLVMTADSAREVLSELQKESVTSVEKVMLILLSDRFHVLLVHEERQEAREKEILSMRAEPLREVLPDNFYSLQEGRRLGYHR